MNITILDELKELKEGQEIIIYVKGQAFVVSLATENDIERIGKGHFCLD